MMLLGWSSLVSLMRPVRRYAPAEAPDVASEGPGALPIGLSRGEREVGPIIRARKKYYNWRSAKLQRSVK